MRNLSWRVKLLGLFTLVLSASLLFQLLYVLPTIRNHQVEMIQTHQEQIAYNIAWGLDSALAGIENSVRRLAERSEFRNMDIGKQQQTIPQIAELLPDVSSLYVMDAEGWFVAGTTADLSVFRKKSYTDKPYYIATFEQGQVYFAAPRSYYDNTLVTTAISVPIESDTGERVGLLLGTMSLNQLIESVANYPLDEETALFLVDREGTVVAHSGVDLFALEEGPLSLDYSSRSSVQAIMAGETGMGGEYEHEGVSYYGNYSILESNDWGIVVEVPMSVVLGKTEALGRQLLWSNIALFAIVLAVTLVFTQQITAERKQMQEQLVRSERLATLGKFSGSISHELRNPLGVIDSSIYYLKTKLKDADEKVQQHLDRVKSSVNSATSIIESLLNLTRMKEPQLSGLDLIAITSDAISTSKVPTGVNVVQKLAKQEVLVNADREQLRMAFKNIIKNAIEAMDGKGTLTVTVHASVDGQAEVAFADTGPGIAPEDLDKIFQPLFTTKAKGIGFGLSIVKTVVDKHGGTIAAKSEPGKGATIIIRLPSYVDKAKEV